MKPFSAVFSLYLLVNSRLCGSFVLKSLNSSATALAQGINEGRSFPKHTVEIIRSHGYPVEVHQVETEDGYLLEIHRIPPLKWDSAGNRPKLPVLLAHGNFQSSAEWVINTPTNASLGFILHDTGHDVWMSNHRGNPYGTKHKRLSPHSPKFWDFTLHEMGVYDMPAIVDYVLSQTGASKVHYVTLSMGPAVFLAGITSKPEYNEKIASAILMGPTVFMGNFYNGLTYYLSWLSKPINVFLNTFGSRAMIPHPLGNYMSTMLPQFCNPKVDIIGLCFNWIHAVYGNDEVMTKWQVAQVFATTPASGSSLKLGNHVLQLWGSKGFHPYDYGRSKNKQIYGAERPPAYNLTNARVPIALFVGKYDIMGHREDAKRLAKELPNLIEYYESPYEKFCHLTFVYGREVAAQLYYRAIDIFKKYDFDNG